MMLEPVPTLDLGKVLEHYGVHYINRPGWHNILCPVHDERNPDCGLNLDLGKIHCHACGFHGDALDLIRELEGLGLADAIELAKQAGFVQGGGGIRKGPPPKPRRGLSGGAGHRPEDGRGAEARLRKPGRPS